jgi:hypothetical protein
MSFGSSFLARLAGLLFLMHVGSDIACFYWYRRKADSRERLPTGKGETTTTIITTTRTINANSTNL